MKFKKFLKLAFISIACVFAGNITGCEESGPQYVAPSYGEVDGENISDFFDEFESTEENTFKFNGLYCDSASYNTDEKNKVSTLPNGLTSIGTLSFIGESAYIEDYGTSSGLANMGSALGFVYRQVINDVEYNGKEYLLNSDSTKTVFGHKIGSVHSGALIIEKSYDNKEWKLEGYCSNINFSSVGYFPSGEDISKGVYLRFYNVAQLVRYIKSSDTYEAFYIVQIYNMFVGSDLVTVKFTCESLEEYKIESEEHTTEELSFLQKGITLTDGSVSFSHIKVEVDDNESCDCKYSYWGEDKEISDKEIHETTILTRPGKYEFTIRTSFGSVRRLTIYLFDPGDDYGFTTYFGDGLFDKTLRMFDLTRPVPTYMVGKKGKINSIPEYFPGLYGTLKYYPVAGGLNPENEQIIETFENHHDGLNKEFTEPGYYFFDLFNCDITTASGDTIHYLFSFFISENKNYCPSFNYAMLKDPSRSFNFKSKVYCVSLPTTGGGHYQFIYPYKEKYVNAAYELAVKIEELSVEIYEEAGEKVYYYKSEENPNVKIAYTDKVKMYELINKNAKENITLTYLNESSPFGKYLVDDDSLKELVNTSIPQTTRVVESEAILHELRGEELFLNDFKFSSPADYEVDRVEAVDEDGVKYDIPFDTELDTIFDKNAKLTITEHNWNGTRTYDAVYLKEISTEVKINTATFDLNIDPSMNGKTFNVINATFSDFVDKYDSEILITVSTLGLKKTMYLEEALGTTLPQGKFKVTISNRLGMYYDFTLNVTLGTQNNQQNNYYNQETDLYSGNIDTTVMPAELNTPWYKTTTMAYVWGGLIGAGGVLIIVIIIAIIRHLFF